jgi:hypothetical protein
MFNGLGNMPWLNWVVIALAFGEGIPFASSNRWGKLASDLGVMPLPIASTSSVLRVLLKVTREVFLVVDEKLTVGALGLAQRVNSTGIAFSRVGLLTRI